MCKYKETIYLLNLLFGNEDAIKRDAVEINSSIDCDYRVSGFWVKDDSLEVLFESDYCNDYDGWSEPISIPIEKFEIFSNPNHYSDKVKELRNEHYRITKEIKKLKNHSRFISKKINDKIRKLEELRASLDYPESKIEKKKAKIAVIETWIASNPSSDDLDIVVALEKVLRKKIRELDSFVKESRDDLFRVREARGEIDKLRKVQSDTDKGIRDLALKLKEIK